MAEMQPCVPPAVRALSEKQYLVFGLRLLKVLVLVEPYLTLNGPVPVRSIPIEFPAPSRIYISKNMRGSRRVLPVVFRQLNVIEFGATVWAATFVGVPGRLRHAASATLVHPSVAMRLQQARIDIRE